MAVVGWFGGFFSLLPCLLVSVGVLWAGTNFWQLLLPFLTTTVKGADDERTMFELVWDNKAPQNYLSP